MNTIIVKLVFILSVCLTLVILGCGESSNPVYGGTSTNTSTSTPESEEVDSGQDEMIEVEEDNPPDEIIEVEVPDPPVVDEDLDANQQFALETFKRDDIVIVQNTGNAGLFIRDPPELDEKRKNVVGAVFDDAIGTIIGGPKIKNKLVWFEIKWAPPLERGGCNERKPCFGWSVAVTPNGTRVLGLVK